MDSNTGKEHLYLNSMRMFFLNKQALVKDWAFILAEFYFRNKFQKTLIFKTAIDTPSIKQLKQEIYSPARLTAAIIFTSVPY